MRGEYQLAAGSSIRLEELPPRARRIQILLVGGDIPPGTTSACAENTYRGHQNDQNEGNYLRVRGEYLLLPWVIWWPAELPPRARRIRDRTVLVDVAHGTTSACAENTDFLDSAGDVGGNYLRVRGEYTCHACARAREWELPPRARRILYQLITMIFTDGTTSACAENTSPLGGTVPWRWNYLRVRGEYVIAPSSSM